jgi:glycosyltransferase involved in cell wall biosynthesis
VLIEALACGLPVVTTRLSGIPELVIDGVTGVLAEPGDPDALAAALERVLDDPDAARRWAEAGRARVEREFDIKDSAARLAALFMAAGSLDSRSHGDLTKQAAD